MVPLCFMGAKGKPRGETRHFGRCKPRSVFHLSAMPTQIPPPCPTESRSGLPTSRSSPPVPARCASESRAAGFRDFDFCSLQNSEPGRKKKTLHRGQGRLELPCSEGIIRALELPIWPLSVFSTSGLLGTMGTIPFPHSWWAFFSFVWLRVSPCFPIQKRKCTVEIRHPGVHQQPRVTAPPDQLATTELSRLVPKRFTKDTWRAQKSRVVPGQSSSFEWRSQVSKSVNPQNGIVGLPTKNGQKRRHPQIKQHPN